MKVLICGLGSIGKRHMENLEVLGFKCEDILIFRTGKGSSTFGNEVLTKHGNKHPIFHDLQKALEERPEIAIISNPTSLHVTTAIEAAEAGCHIFMEKPLSHNLQNVYTLLETLKSNKKFGFMAHNLRFHPLLMVAKQWLDELRIGKVVSISAEMSERVTDWHPWEDFRTSYATRSDLGGGVVSAQCHEIDYLYYLFGKPEWVFAAGGELGDLNIGVEDTAKIIMSFDRKIIASLHVDYLKKPARGFLEITGTKGRIYWDYFNSTLQLIPIVGNPIVIDDWVRADRTWKAETYLSELGYFLSCITSNIPPSPDLNDGKNVLEIIMAIKQSVTERKIAIL